MLEKIKNGDEGLWRFVKICMIIVMIAAAIIAIVLWKETDIFSAAVASVFGGAVVCISIYLNYFIAGLFFLAACDKGYNDIVYIRVPFFLGVVGYLLVCALPVKDGPVHTKASKKQTKNKSKTKNPVDVFLNMPTEEEIEAEGAGSDFEDYENDMPKRKCPKCGTVHDFDCPKCPKCKYNYYQE